MSDENIETLILSPHVDDEVLGSFSFLGKNTYVLYFGVEDRPKIPRQMRMQELEHVATNIGLHWKILENTVNHYHAPELIAPIEAAINQLRPMTVLLPEPSYNQDHRAVYEAGLIATRPHDINWFVQSVLVFEQPQSVMWPYKEPQQPTYFKEIDVEKKLHLYSLYESQVRGHRSPEIVKAIAFLRGSQICVPFAEAFHVKRMVAT